MYLQLIVRTLLSFSKIHNRGLSMNLASVTCVEQQPVVQPEPKVLRLLLKVKDRKVQLLTREVLDVALDKLAMIAHFYRDWDDDLSRQLSDWVFEVIDLDGYSEEIDEEFVNVMEEKIKVLRTEILINSIDRAPLVNPILVDQSIWENWMWNDFSAIIPQPGRVVKLHSFALRIIEWKNDLPFEELNPTLQLTDPVFVPLVAVLPNNTRPFLDQAIFEANNSPSSQLLKIMTYTNCMCQANIIAKEQRLRREIVAATEACRALWMKATESISLLKDVIQKDADLHCRKLKQVLEEIESTHEDEVQVLSGMITQQKARLDETRTRLKATEQRCALQEGEIRTLRGQVVEQQNNVEELNRKVRKKKRSFGIF